MLKKDLLRRTGGGLLFVVGAGLLAWLCWPIPQESIEVELTSYSGLAGHFSITHPVFTWYGDAIPLKLKLLASGESGQAASPAGTPAKLFLEGKLELTGSAVQPGPISYAPIIYGEPLELDWLVAPDGPGQQAGTLWLYAVQPAGGSLGAVGKAFVARPFSLTVSGLAGMPALFLRVGAGVLGVLGLLLWLPLEKWLAAKKKKPVKIKKTVRP